jgi:hypothetical protein
MMYESANILVWWAFIGGVSSVALLTVVLALVWRWAAPSSARSTG